MKAEIGLLGLRGLSLGIHEASCNETPLKSFDKIVQTKPETCQFPEAVKLEMETLKSLNPFLKKFNLKSEWRK